MNKPKEIKLNFKNISETEGNLTLIKAQKEIAKSKLSEYKFYNEYMEAMFLYYDSVFNTIGESLALSLNINPDDIKKSYNLDYDFLKTISEKDGFDKWILKSLFAKLKEKFAKFNALFKKFNINGGDRIEPFKMFQKFIYDPKNKSYLTEKDIKETSDAIVKFLKNRIASTKDEAIVRAMVFGKFVEKMKREGKTEKQIQNMSYEEVEEKENGLPNNKTEYEEKYRPERATKNGMEWALSNAGKYLSIENSEIKNKIINYTSDLISNGLAMKRPAYEMVSDFYYQGKEKLQSGITEWNRDIQRIILTESKNAMESGKMLEAKEWNDKQGKKTYMMFDGAVNPAEGMDEPCNIWIGEICLVVDEPRDNDRIKDPYAKYCIWAGKTNAGRKKGNWWICIAVHPRCKHFWSSVNPEAEGAVYYDKEKGYKRLRSINVED